MSAKLIVSLLEEAEILLVRAKMVAQVDRDNPYEPAIDELQKRVSKLCYDIRKEENV